MTRTDDDDDYDRHSYPDAECEGDACQSCLPPKYCRDCMTKLATGLTSLRSRVETAEAALAELNQQLDYIAQRDRDFGPIITTSGSYRRTADWVAIRARELGWKPQ